MFPSLIIILILRHNIKLLFVINSFKKRLYTENQFEKLKIEIRSPLGHFDRTQSDWTTI